MVKIFSKTIFRDISSLSAEHFPSAVTTRTTQRSMLFNAPNLKR